MDFVSLDVVDICPPLFFAIFINNSILEGGQTCY